MKYRLLRCYSPSEDLPPDVNVTWDDIKPASPDDVWTGRNLYIESKVVNGVFMTKASAGKIIKCIEEGFMPLQFNQSEIPDSDYASYEHAYSFVNVLYDSEGHVIGLYDDLSGTTLYCDPKHLEKPFTSVHPAVSPK